MHGFETGCEFKSWLHHLLAMECISYLGMIWKIMPRITWEMYMKFYTQDHVRNVYEVYTQCLSCKEQTPRLSSETHAKFLPVYSVGPGNPSVLCGGRTEQAEAPAPGPWIPNTGLGAGELRGQGSPDNSWALPFPFHSLLLPLKQTKSKDSLRLNRKTVF